MSAYKVDCRLDHILWKSHANYGACLVAQREMLGDLQESFNSLEEGSKSMVAQVRASLHCDLRFYTMERLNIFAGKETGCAADCQGVVLVQVEGTFAVSCDVFEALAVCRVLRSWDMYHHRQVAYEYCCTKLVLQIRFHRRETVQPNIGMITFP